MAFGAVWTDGEPLIRALGSADLRAGRALSSTTPFLANPIPIRWVHLAHETGPSLDALTGARVGLEPKLAAIPGTKFAYSNLGYLLLRIYPRLGYAVAALANETSFPTEHLTRLVVR